MAARRMTMQIVSGIAFAVVMLIAAGCSFTDRHGDSRPLGLIVPTRNITEIAILPQSTPSETVTQDATAASDTAAPTTQAAITEEATPTLGDTATSTVTDSPTDTASPTATPSATHTPTATDTPTLTATSDTTQPPLTTVSVFTNSTAFLQPQLQPFVALDTPVTGEINDGSPVVVYPFRAMAGVPYNISVTSVDENFALDTLLLILTTKGQELARNDDRTFEVRDSQVRGFIPPEDGDYLLVVTRYYGRLGFSTGTFELVVEEGDENDSFGEFSLPLRYGSTVEGTIDDSDSEVVYSFRGAAGDVISVNLRAISGNLDTVVSMTDNLGTTLITNDDGERNTTNSAFNEYVLLADGYYTLIATRYQSNDTDLTSGDYELTLTLDAAAGSYPRDAYAIDALLDTQNSRTLRADARFYTSYQAGDVIDNEGSELRMQPLLTFRLPPMLSLDEIASAQLTWGFCYESGGGFDALGELTIYADEYGRIDAGRDLTRTTTGARIIDTINGCDPVDMTDTVRQIMETNGSVVQLRVVFRAGGSNGESDQVRFSQPRLQITRTASDG